MTSFLKKDFQKGMKSKIEWRTNVSLSNPITKETLFEAKFMVFIIKLYEEKYGEIQYIKI